MPPAPLYPMLQLERRKAALRARGRRIFDFGTGDPPEPTPEIVRRALIDSVPLESAYPSVSGEEDLRAAAAAYFARRFGVTLDAEREILPTAGSKATVFHLPMALLEPGSARDTVVWGEPGYAVFALAARYAHARGHAHPLRFETRYLLAPEDLGDELLARTALVFLNYPHNPSGEEMPAELYRRWVAARDAHGFVLVSDECYCDLWFEHPPHSLLEFGREGCLALHSLSKRSGMTGYLSGFVAGDARLVETLARFHAACGVLTPVWTQGAAAAAWRDAEHVEERRLLFAAKRRVLLEVLAARGLRVHAASASLFLWAELPEGQRDLDYAERLLEAGIVVSPGSFFGSGQERFIRLALVPSLEECREVAALWPRD